MKTISKEQARRIAADWHDGQNSPLYQFASSGVFIASESARYLQAAQRCIDKDGHSVYAKECTKTELLTLGRLKRYFESESAKAGHKVTAWEKYPGGYELLPVFDNIEGLSAFMLTA
jgi:hypothetical protein